MNERNAADENHLRNMTEREDEAATALLRAHDHVVTISREEHEANALDIIVASDRIETLERENAELHDVLAAMHALVEQKDNTIRIIDAALHRTASSLSALESAHEELRRELGFRH